MSSISKRLSLRVPANVIYRSLKDTRLEQLFPEFFTGVTRKLTSNNKANSELQFATTTYDSQIHIKEIFNLKVLHSNATEITYTTSTNIANDPVVESIVHTHIANVLYALLMLETGYVNGLMERQIYYKIKFFKPFLFKNQYCIRFFTVCIIPWYNKLKRNFCC